MQSSRIEMNIDALSQAVAVAGKPVHINLLARTAVAAWLQHNAHTRQYAPGATYQPGETIQWNGRSATITAIQPGHNPKQGAFQILTLTLPDGSKKQMAAGIANTPSVDRQELTEAQVDAVLQQDGLRWRTVVHETLASLPEFAHFQDEQGDHWCLTGLLPGVTEAELQHVWTSLQEQTAAPFQTVPTSSLVMAVWGQPDDGSAEYRLFAFALNVALQPYREVQYVAGAGWMLSDRWRELAQRPSLIGPRMSNIVPEATDDEEEEMAVPAPQPKPADDAPFDMETWRQERRNQAALVLKASHYYYHWLPMTREMQRLFPGWPSQVTIYHHFGGQEGCFTAVIHPEQKRLLADRTMYEALRESGVYPGARLVFSHRGSDYAYDVRTRPVSGEQSVTVRRLALDPDTGELAYWEDEEPLRYEVDGDVFVADARWEDLPALFRQAETAGQGIFGLMYQQCQEWRAVRGAPLVVTADELFTTIHNGPRLTSKATIAFELWRRQAFVSLGNGRYQFQPEKGDHVRTYGLQGHRISPMSGQSDRQTSKTKSFRRGQTNWPQPGLPFTADALWTAVQADAERWHSLTHSLTAYKSDPFREKMLFLRGMAHQSMRQLLALDRLETLTLKEFNHHVWQLGAVTYQGQRARLDSPDIVDLLGQQPLAKLQAAHAAGELVLAGNQTWGSATGVYGAQLRLDDTAKLALLRDTLRNLLYGPGDDGERLAHVLAASNGFGMNIATGLLHVVYPERHILYNTRSIEMLTDLGIDWPVNWPTNVSAYLVYRDFMQRLQGEADLESLTDVDWFVYVWGMQIDETHIVPDSSSDSTPSLPAVSVSRREGVVSNSFWQAIQALEGVTLTTTVQKAPFLVTAVSNESVTIQVQSSGRIYVIYRTDLETIWHTLEIRRRLEQQAIRDEFKMSHPVYSAAILAALPGVTTLETRPVQLALEQQDNVDPSASLEPQEIPGSRADQDGTVSLEPFHPTPERIWQVLAEQIDQPLVTLVKGRPFHITRLTESTLYFRDDEQNQEHGIDRQDINAAVRYVAQHGRIRGRALQEMFPKAHPKYLAAILAALPGIDPVNEPDHLVREAGDAAHTAVPSVDEFTQIKKLVQTHLTQSEIITPGGKSNLIVGFTETGLLVRSSKGEAEVTWEWVEQVYDKLRELGAIERNDVQKGEHRVTGGYRSAFIFGVLARFGHVTLQTEPRARLVYAPPVGAVELRLVGFLPKTTPVEPDTAAPLPQPTIEHTRSGQLVAADLIPTGPLLDQPIQPTQPTNQPANQPANPPTKPTLPPIKPYFRPRPDTGKLGDDMTRTSKSLFAAHYLEYRLGDHPEWQADPAPALAALQSLYQNRQHLLPQYNEAQTEDEFIKPALEILGFAMTVQTGLNRAGRSQRPDYALFADSAQKAAADKFLKDEGPFYDRALAITEAKYWERPLTVQHADTGRAQYDNRNPSFQIVNYLTGTAVDWGILTNGRFWRLYYRQASSMATEFYEVDLVELVEKGDLEAFKRFWLFFRKEAFVPDRHGVAFLDAVRQGSATYARRVSDQLKGRVFNEVFPLLAGGFVADMARRGEQPDSDESKALIYEATLSLLYKLLFLLYGEARDLLPIDHPGYWRESLTNLAQSVARRIDRADPLGETSTGYYRRLLGLFEVIDRGDAALGLPRYNGGLFHFDFTAPDAAQKHRANYFLTQHTINDGRLAQALDRLARLDGERVDYSFLEVRHLGAVYEGLLEYRLVIEEAAAGRVHLATDKGERKATGSYYTPDYIVKYIVHHTLAPILQARAQRFGELMTDITPKRARLNEISLQSPVSSPQSPATQTRHKHETHVLRQELDRLEKEARETLLDIKVCDPAMGSGHFLVEAVDYLTDRLIEILNQHPDHNPVLAQLEAIRRAILDNMAAQGIAIEAARLDDTQLLQRAVMKRCIYGVDLNRMAVELAKVSLWLHSFTIGAPLSFLDHHLRWGNSLIGASARQAEQELTAGSGQMTLFGGPFKGLLRAAEVMRGISGLSDATLAEVAESEALFREFDEAARPYKQLLDVRVAQHFGVKRAAEFLTLYGVDAIKAGPESVGPIYAQPLRETQALFEEKRFFHWELEFPEVFIDLDLADWKSNPGFDAIVGNPPYDVLAERERQEDLKPLMNYLENQPNLHPALGRKVDLYRLFVSQALILLCPAGQVGFIMPMSIMADLQTFPLRKHILQNHTLRDIQAFPQKDDPKRRVFTEAKLPTCIVIIERGTQSNEPFSVFTHPGHLLDEVSGCYHATLYDIEALGENLNIPLASDTAFRLAVRLTSNDRFQKFGDVLITYQGEINETTMRNVLSEEPSIGPQVLRGGNVQRYEFIEQPKQGTDKYINIQQLYKEYKGEKVEHTKVFRIGYQRNAALDNWRRLIFSPLPVPSFCFDSISYYVVGDERTRGLFFLSLLNSKLLNWRFSLTSTNNHVNAGEIATLPLRRVFPLSINDNDVQDATKAMMMYEGILSGKHQAEFLEFVTSLEGNGRLGVVSNLLASLAGKMLDLSSQKQLETKGFLGWLADYTGLPIDNWALKTIAQSYHEAGWEEFKRALNRNARATQQASGVDVQGREALGRIKREYERSTAVLTPLLGRIQATDALIDQIVYKLYGLTEEEIAIVEGRV